MKLTDRNILALAGWGVLLSCMPGVVALFVLLGRKQPQFQPWMAIVFAASVFVPWQWLLLRRLLRLQRTAQRAERGQCRICGYDLTGNVSGTCPECGQKVGTTDVTQNKRQRASLKQK
ncbi:MAG: hypothetical protein JWL69_1333 [Phycisphaerales bacterium]|nr:hypothetical protein [Phycisphaerales bacterium]